MNRTTIASLTDRKLEAVTQYVQCLVRVQLERESAAWPRLRLMPLSQGPSTSATKGLLTRGGDSVTVAALTQAGVRRVIAHRHRLTALRRTMPVACRTAETAYACPHLQRVSQNRFQAQTFRPSLGNRRDSRCIKPARNARAQACDRTRRDQSGPRIIF